jgi:hypothetical protein
LTNLFDPKTTTEETPLVDGSYVEALVGEGKKFKDVEALARGKHEADIHVQQVQREAAAARQRITELEAQLQERITIEEFMSELKTPRDDASHVTTPDLIQPSVKPQSPDDIGALIDARLQEQRRNEQIQANLASVANTLQQTWGANWQQKLTERAKELNLSHKFLDDVAKESPQGFLNVVLPQTSAPRSDPNNDLPPRTSISRSIPAQDIGARSKSYYDKMKQSDPKTYHSDKMVAQRHRDAQRLGEAYFDN